MIDASFITRTLTNARLKPEKRAPRLGMRPHVPRLPQKWNDWKVVEESLKTARFIETHKGARIWAVTSDVYVAENDNWFKASTSLQHAEKLAHEMSRGGGVSFRILPKPGRE